jgi:hypothetical protein
LEKLGQELSLKDEEIKEEPDLENRDEKETQKDDLVLYD